jgi:hypothetical protein
MDRADASSPRDVVLQVVVVLVFVTSGSIGGGRIYVILTGLFHHPGWRLIIIVVTRPYVTAV